MKYLIIALFMVSLFANVVYSDVYITYDSSLKEIKSISGQDDAVVEPGWSQTILPGKVSDYPLIYDAKYYKFKNNALIVNIKKISDEENDKDERKDKIDDMVIIQNRLYKDACELIKLEGKNLKKIKCTDF